MKNENGYKYCLIVSQYYHSRHMFVVELNDSFMESAANLTNELNAYKRDKEKPENIGDLDCKHRQGKLYSRYNVNDSGDIYFINKQSINGCMHEAFGYKEDSRRESVGYKKKVVQEAIYEHHDFNTIRDIVVKHFTIL